MIHFPKKYRIHVEADVHQPFCFAFFVIVVHNPGHAESGLELKSVFRSPTHALEVDVFRESGITQVRSSLQGRLFPTTFQNRQ